MPELKRVADALNKRHFKARCFETSEEAVKAILDLIPNGAEVGAGGSMTLAKLGVLEALHTRGNAVYAADLAKKLNMDAEDARKKSMTARFYLTSANALTIKGEIVNTDGRGNRVAAMFYGPETVIIVAGRNKIVKNRAAAFARIKNVASPKNVLRLHKDTPCARTGICEDCDTPDRICRVTTIIDYALADREIHVFLINEDLGF
jgi:L-lactate utilization protein LutB